MCNPLFAVCIVPPRCTWSCIGMMGSRWSLRNCPYLWGRRGRCTDVQLPLQPAALGDRLSQHRANRSLGGHRTRPCTCTTHRVCLGWVNLDHRNIARVLGRWLRCNSTCNTSCCRSIVDHTRCLARMHLRGCHMLPLSSRHNGLCCTGLQDFLGTIRNRCLHCFLD